MSTRLKTGDFVFGISSNTMSVFEAGDFYFGLVIWEKPIHVLSLHSLFIFASVQKYEKKKFDADLLGFRNGDVSFEHLNKSYNKLIYIVREHDWQTRLVTFSPTASGYEQAIAHMKLLSNVTAEQANDRTLPFEIFQRRFLKPSDSFDTQISPKLSL